MAQTLSITSDLQGNLRITLDSKLVSGVIDCNKTGAIVSTNLVTTREESSAHELEQKEASRTGRELPKYGFGDWASDLIRVVTIGKIQSCGGGCNRRRQWLNKHIRWPWKYFLKEKSDGR